MLPRILCLRVGLVLLVGSLVLYSGSSAMGDRRMVNRGEHRGDARRDNKGYNGNNRGEKRHYYREGRWYRHDERGNEVTVADLIVGALVEALPPQHTTVVVRGSSYYYDNSRYYQQSRNGGYVVVRAPRR